MATRDVSEHAAGGGGGGAGKERLRFPRAMRLTHDREYARVYAARVSRVSGPLVVHVCGNRVGRARLGLSVSRKVGPAVVRNRVKRLIRESFRLRRSGLEAGVDYVVGVRTPVREKIGLGVVEEHFVRAASAAAAAWTKKYGRAMPGDDA